MIDVNEFHKLLGYNTKESYEKAIMELYIIYVSETKVSEKQGILSEEEYGLGLEHGKKEILTQIEDLLTNLINTKNDKGLVVVPSSEND